MTTATTPRPAARRARGRRRASGAALLGLVATTLAVGLVEATPAQAVPSTGLMITEVYPGGGNASATYNSDFVELYNASNAPISLDGKSLQYRSSLNAGIPIGTNVFALPAVSVPAHSYFLVKGASGTNGVDLPKTPDAFSSLAMGGSAGQVYLADSATGIAPVTAPGSVAGGGSIDYGAGKVIDFVGYGTQGTATGQVSSYEGASRNGTLSTASSLKRASTPVDTDNNQSDFTISAVSPGPDSCACVAPNLKVTEVYTEGGNAGAARDHDYVEIYNPGSTLVLDGLGLTLQYRAPGATGPATVIAPLTGTMAGGSYDIALLGAGGPNGAAIDSPQYTNASVELSTAGGTVFIAKSATAYDPGTGAFAKDQYVADLVGWGSSNVYETTAASVADLTPATSLTRAPGAVDTDVNLDDLTADQPYPDGAPPFPVRTIAEIQGTGATTPTPNALVETSGVVTGSYTNASGGLKGYYLQTPGPDTPDASDAIFVYTGSLSPQPTPPTVGHAVTVRGRVSEFAGMTEITQSFLAGSFVDNGVAPVQIVPRTVLPGTDCALPGTSCLTGAALAAEREKAEAELFLPTQDFTVSDSYDGSPWTQTNITDAVAMAGEIGLAANDTNPLIAPTEVVSPSADPAGLAARKAYNDAHMITLDDGADMDFVGSAFEDIENFPWFTKTNTVRIGAAATFHQPMVLDFRNDLWRLQPQSRVTGAGTSFVSFEQDRPATPDDVLGATGDLKIATFNMLNYFNTVGEDWVAANPSKRTCTYYTDRGVPAPAARISNNTCTEDSTDPVTGLPIVLPGPRGAATQTSFLRQEAKELQAINTMDADVMTLEEVENSLKIGDADRDDALIRLVAQLNADYATKHPAAPSPRWAYVASPRLEAQPTLLEQDAIRTAFIYNPTKVEPVGASRILVNSAPFRNAREPLAQAFKPVGGGRADTFLVVINHFKSKGGPTAPSTVNGDNVDQGDGAGFYNGDRKRQAAAVAAFAKQMASDLGVGPIFMTGDYNAYTQEDPIQVLRNAGFTDLQPADGEASYSFGGLAGSLDHVFVNQAAHDMVTGEDIWTINANESVYYEYSRYNANLTDLYDANQFRSSDHNPEIIGIDTGALTPDPDVDTVQVLATNDFHGRILDNPGDASAGAASLAGAVKGLRADNENTIFAAAGDLIGASTFESFIANDKPTIDALNEAGLEVSAAGNHEFDRGYQDLVDRVMAPESAGNPDGGAGWQYIAANVKLDGANLLPESWCETLPDGRTIGFVGAVTEDLLSLVAGSGMQGITVTDIVSSVNAAADRLKTPAGCDGAGPADIVIELVHEGAATTSYSSVTDGSTFGQIVAGADANIDAIVSGHTHLAYNHAVPVPAWAGRAVTKRPVVSAGQYGANLNRLEFEFDTTSGELVDIRQTVLALKDYAADPDTQAIVDDAVDYAAVQGNAVLGDSEGPLVRARQNDPVSGNIIENRGGESTLGNQIAEIQRWRTGADLALMNPGGLRADILGLAGTPRQITYRQAADAQPFANTLVTMDLTGAQLKTILEQQWQRDPDGNIPSRPFLRLGTSAGFTSTYDATRPEGDRITGMWLDGARILPAQTYRVASTSFLASGTGDNFFGFAAATHRQDTGKTDLQAVVDYLGDVAQHGVDPPLEVPYGQHQVGVTLTGTVPTAYEEGDTLAMDVSSLAMTGTDDVVDTTVQLLLGGTVLGTAPVSNTLSTTPDDHAGTASFSVTLPSGLGDGSTILTLRGTATGTEVPVRIPTSDGRIDTTVTGQDQTIPQGSAGSVPVTVTPSAATGTVTLSDGATVIGSTALAGGAGSIDVPAGSLSTGPHTLTLTYGGDATYGASVGSVTVTVTALADSTLTAPTLTTVEYGDAGSLPITVTPSSATGTVTVKDGTTTIGSASIVGGVATVTLPARSLEVGDHLLSLSYEGDSTTAPATGTAAVTITKASTTTTATADPMVYGTDGSVDVSVDSAVPVSGQVRLLDGATLVANGTVGAGGGLTLTIPGDALDVGTTTLTVSYVGDEDNAASSGTVDVVVTQATSTTTATVTPTTVVVGRGTVRVQAEVTADGFTPTGSVEVRIGTTVVRTVDLADGEIDTTLAAFTTVGTKQVSVVYLGDATTQPSASAATGVTVTKAKPTVKVTQKPSKVVVKKTKVKLLTTVKATGQKVTGKVKVTYGGKSWTAALKNQVATITLPVFTSTGTKTVTITYLGSAKASAVTVKKKVKVVAR